MKQKIATLLVMTLLFVGLVPVSVNAQSISIVIDDDSQNIYPGESSTFLVNLTNTLDEDVDVAVSVTGVPFNWTVGFDEEIVHITSNDTVSVNMTVTVPSDADIGAISQMEVHATPSRGNEDSVEFEVRVGLGVTINWKESYPITAPLGINSGDVGAMPVETVDAVGGIVYEVRVICFNFEDNLKSAPWLFENPSDPYTLINETYTDIWVDDQGWDGSRYEIYYYWEIPSGTNTFYVGISPDPINSSVGDMANMRVAYRINGSGESPVDAEDPGGNIALYWEVVQQDYWIEFTTVETGIKTGAPGGMLEYYFNLTNKGNATAEIEYITEVTALRGDVEVNYTDWGVQLGSHRDGVIEGMGLFTPIEPERYDFLTIEEGSYTYNGFTYENEVFTRFISWMPPVNWRIDTLVAFPTNPPTYDFIRGVPANDPLPPDLPNGAMPLFEVLLDPDDIYIQDASRVTDVRPFLGEDLYPLSTVASPSRDGYGYSTVNYTSGNDTSRTDRLVITIPSNATEDDRVRVRVTAHILSSSKERAFSRWYPGNAINESVEDSGGIDAASWFSENLWLTIGAIMVIIGIGVGLIMLKASKSGMNEFRGDLSSPRTQGGTTCGKTDKSLTQMEKDHPNMRVWRKGDQICGVPKVKK